MADSFDINIGVDTFPTSFEIGLQAGLSETFVVDIISLYLKGVI